MKRLNDDELDKVFAALADRTRRSMVARLVKGERTVQELAEPFGMSQPAISKHLKVLEEAGLISSSQDQQRRPRRLEPKRLQQVAEWVGGYQEYWQESYERLDEYLQQLKKEKRDGKEARGRRSEK
jgi:DNA-binding transcriptional ArsR family regulator